MQPAPGASPGIASIAPPGMAVFAPADAAALANAMQLSVAGLMHALLPWAASFADAPISGFAVGAIALGSSGALYAGANLEFPGQALSFSVHAEQAAITNAWLTGETGIEAIAVTATPCGYCRQFLNELTSANRLQVFIDGSGPLLLAELLPAAFGPANLGVTAGLLDASLRRLAIDDPSAGSEAVTGDALIERALAAAERSYAPYSKTLAGVAVSAAGAVYEGRYAENAAFNPSLSPLASALVGLRLARGLTDEISRIVLVETAGLVGQRGAAEALSASVAPGVRLEYLRARPAGDTDAAVEESGGLDSTDNPDLS